MLSKTQSNLAVRVA